MKIKNMLVLIGLVLGVAMSGFAQEAKPAEVVKAKPVEAGVEKIPQLDAEWNNPLPSSQFTVGLHFGDQQAESFGDILVPLVQFKSGLLFINPRGSWNDSDGQEFNLGLGYRHLIPEKSIILGGNAYYDLRNTSLDNTFNQFGCGLEFLSTWVDARVNVYIPEGGDKTVDEYAISTGTAQEQGSYWYSPTGQGHDITQYGYEVANTYEIETMQHFQMTETAMEGYDCEIGALLPIPVVQDHADVKIFGGYFDYNAHYGDDIDGVKARLEVKPMPALYLDAAWYEDEALLGSKYSVGARVSLPFDLANLSRGKNPFAGAMDGFRPGAAKPDFASRMTEMVVRDLHIRTDMSQPEEVIEDRQQMSKTLVSTSRKDYNVVLASGVTFVDNDNTSGVEDGSWENPYSQINEGVQNAVGAMVYVRDATQQYYENVVMREGMTLWGSGAPIYGQGNRFLGGIYPVVNGMGTGPAITLANNVTVAGLEIIQTPTSYVTAPEKGIYSTPAGIYGVDVTDVNIYKNYIHGGDRAIVLDCYNMPVVRANITENRIEGNYNGEMLDTISADGAKTPSMGGISIFLQDVNQADITLANNDVTHCYGDGLMIYADGNDNDQFVARVSGNYSDNGGDGVSLMVQGYRMAAGLFVDVTANNNSGNGIYGDFYYNDTAIALVASHNDLDRIEQMVQTVTGGIPFLGEGLDGLNLADMIGVSDLYRAGGVMQANGNGAEGIYLNQQSEGANLAALLGVQADGNGYRNLGSAIVGDSGSTKNIEVEFDGAGISVNQAGSDGTPFLSIAALVRCQANNNAGDGMQVNSSADEIAIALFADVTANNNFGSGVRANVDSPDGIAAAVVLSSDPLISLVETITAMPEVNEYVSPMDMSYIPAYGQVQANGNRESGIFLDVDGYDAALALVLDAQANGNGGGMFLNRAEVDDKRLIAAGIDVDVYAEDGMAIGVVASTEALMALVGSILASEEIPLDLSQVRTLGPVQANDNGGSGVALNVRSGYGDAIGLVLGVDAARNAVMEFMPGAEVDVLKAGPMAGGVTMNLFSEQGDAMGALAGINASDNFGSGIDASVRSSAMDGEAMLGGINIIANDNFMHGMDLSVESQSLDSSYLVLGGVMANDNFMGSGINAWVASEGEVMAALTAIQANGNGENGIYVETDSMSGDSSVWISGTAVEDMYDFGGGWNLAGIDLIDLVTPGAIQASGNGDNGVFIDSSTDSEGAVRAYVEDVTALDNERRGVRADLDTMYSGGDIDAAFKDITANGNNNGLRINANSGDEITLSVDNVTASQDYNNGISAHLLADGYVDASFTGNTTENNDANGLRVEAESHDGMNLYLADNVANDNYESGIKVIASTYYDSGPIVSEGNGAKFPMPSTGDIGLQFVGNEANANGEDGLHINADAYQALKIMGEGNVVRNNDDDGIDVKTSAASGSLNRQYDFGGGVLDSEGYNVMDGNGGYQMERSGAGVFNAQYNYWDGDESPDYNEEYVGNNMNVANALAVDPTIP